MYKNIEKPKSFILPLRLLMFILILIIAGADYYIGDILSLYLLYLFPIVFLSFNDKRNISLIAAIFSSILWISVDYQLGSLQPSLIFASIESVSRIIIFTLSAFFISAYRQTHLILEQQAFRDEKTGVYNYRAFLEIGTKELSLISRTQQSATLAYFDMDNFKAINDQYGHSKGDQVLVTFTQLVTSIIRSSDIFARIGGDEFVILFLGSTTEQSLPQIELIQSNFNKTMKKEGFPTTISVGMLNVNNNDTLELVTQKADYLMYQAKEQGKNKIIRDDH